MAITDKQAFLTLNTSSGVLEQDIATTTSETVTTNVMDLTAPGVSGMARQIGEGRPLYLNILVTEAVTHGSALSVTFKLYSHSTTSVASGTEHLAITKAKADLTLGTHIRLPVPPAEMARYVGATHTCSASTATGGAFQIWLDIG